MGVPLACLLLLLCPFSANSAALAAAAALESSSSSAAPPPPPLLAPGVVFLTARRSGHRMTVMSTGEVHAKWANKGSWEQLLLEREQGYGELRSGDCIYLTGWNGKRLTMEGTLASAKADDKGEKQKFVIHRMGGDGPISAGDSVFLEAWTGNNIDADNPFAPGVVQAKWPHKGWWQQLTLEALPPAGVPALPPLPTKVHPKAWEHFELIKGLRARGFTCPSGESFAPNSAELAFDCRLWRAAARHSQDMMLGSFFGHASLDGRSPEDRAAEQGAAAHGEEIIAGPDSAQGALDRLTASDSHCRHIMRSDFKTAAVGFAEGGVYGHYWTTLFSESEQASGSSTACYPSG